MSTFHGLCSYPHGGQSSGILWFTLAAATICTSYSMASCRLVVLEFSSTLGNFEDHFVNMDAAPTAESHTVGLGLFTWLLPSYYVDGDDDTITRADINWQEGSCQGYNSLQLAQMLVDPKFDAVRILGVLSVLLSFSIFLFGLMLSCLSLAQWQTYIVCAACGLAAILNGCTLLVVEAGPCINTGQDSSCQLDQGGLVAIAAVLLWICSGLLAFFFLDPPPPGAGMPEKLRQTRTQHQKARARKKMQNETKVDWNNSTPTSKAAARSGASRTRSTSRSSSTTPKKNPKTVHTSHSLPSMIQPRNMDADFDQVESQQERRHRLCHASGQQPSRSAPNKKGGATNKSLETTYIPQSRFQNGTNDNNNNDEEYQPPNQSKQRSAPKSVCHNSKAAAAAAAIASANDDDDGSDDYDCIPYARPFAPTAAMAASVASSSLGPASPLEQPNQRYRSTSRSKQQPPPPPQSNGVARSNPSDYDMPDITASRSMASANHLSSLGSFSVTNHWSARRKAVQDAVEEEEEDLELQRAPTTGWACNAC